MTWETATTTNVGMDLSFLNNRLSATVDWFERRTIDMVGPSQAMPGVLGTGVPKENNSTLRTRGWEISLNWKHALENGLSYNLGISLYDYKSVVTKYFNPTGTLSTWYEGAEVGDIWGYTVNDLFRSQEDLDSYLSKVDMTHIAANWNTGDLKYEDINHDGKVNNGTNTIGNHGDLSVIGNDQPHYQYTINGGVSYKGFDFYMSMYTRQGVRALSDAHKQSSDDPVRYRGFRVNYWTPENRSNDYPAPAIKGTYTDFSNSDYFVKDVSFVRISNISLGYTLPKDFIQKFRMENAKVYININNPFVFTPFDGQDPQVGTDKKSYPSVTSYQLGVNLNF